MEQHSPRQLSLSQIVVLAAVALSASVLADGGTIYRCHSAKDGALIFQDQPCNKAPGTLEAAKNLEGAVIPPAPPPADDGAPVVERYTRYLDTVAADREAQKEADLAAASRLRARADAERTPPAAFQPPQTQGSCTLIGANDECLAYANDYGSYGGYSGYYGAPVPAYNGPYRRRPVDRPRPPPPVTPPAPPAPAARFGAPFRPGFGKPVADDKTSK